MNKYSNLSHTNYESNITINNFFIFQDQFCDVTVACDGKLYSLHKFVLSSCSDYFEAMLNETGTKHPIIVLKDVKSSDFDYILDYMYLGEVNVPQSQLETLIDIAEYLKIRGLAVPDDDLCGAMKRSSNSQSSPKAKRLRRSSPLMDDSTNEKPDGNGSTNENSSAGELNAKPSDPLLTEESHASSLKSSNSNQHPVRS